MSADNFGETTAVFKPKPTPTPAPFMPSEKFGEAIAKPKK